MIRLNLQTWHTERELDYCPKHFVSTNTPISDESLIWILEKLEGRFYIQPAETYSFAALLEGAERIPYFEDPLEATVYELTWS